jgi:hypothetical protein
MDDVVYFALTHAKAKRDTATKFVNECPYRRTRGEMTCNRNLCGVTYPRDFILEIGLNKLNITIVLTSKVAHTFVITKTQTKVILDVGCLDLAPSMVVVLPIHALSQGREFEQNVSIESSWKSKDLLNVHGVVNQSFQFV